MFPITASFEVTVVRGGDFRECAICGTQPPMPDEEALVFLLRNHDHARLVWPAAEGVEEERDCYPVAGWQKNYDRETDEDALICSRCAEDLKAAKAKLKETRRKK